MKYIRLIFNILDYLTSFCIRIPAYWRLSIIFISGVIIRVIFLLYEPLLSRDGISYISMINKWYNLGSYENMIAAVGERFIIIPPFTLFLSKSLMHLGLSAEYSARTLTVILGSIVPVICYGIAIVVNRNKRIAFYSALFLVVNPVLIEYSIQPTRDVFFVLIIGLVIYFSCRGIRWQRLRDWVFSGIFCGIAILTRYEALEIVPYVSLYFLFNICFVRNGKVLRQIKNLIFFLLATCLCIILLNIAMGSIKNVTEGYKEFFFKSNNTSKIRSMRELF